MLEGVHLVGSVALADGESVMRTLAEQLGPWLKRIPDGETGVRHRWIYWQRDMLLNHQDMEIDPDAEPLRLLQWDGQVIRNTQLIRFKPGTDPTKVSFETGYAGAAIESYATFVKLRQEGIIAPGVRFQVCLPTPMASGFMYIAPASLEDYLPAYERSLLDALGDILSAIPANDLAIQWDICQEVLVFENYFPDRPADYKIRIFDEMARLGNAVHEGAQLGYHLCYGTPNDEHLVMPKDLAICVEMTKGVQARLHRRLDFLHLPVPKDRSDGSYTAPLKGLSLEPGANLYLGLIHHDDPLGDVQRIHAASNTGWKFGISTECGWGRGDPERVPDLIAAHRQVMEELG